MFNLICGFSFSKFLIMLLLPTSKWKLSPSQVTSSRFKYQHEKSSLLINACSIRILLGRSEQYLCKGCDRTGPLTHLSPVSGIVPVLTSCEGGRSESVIFTTLLYKREIWHALLLSIDILFCRMEVTIMGTFLRPILSVASVWNTEKLVPFIHFHSQQFLLISCMFSNHHYMLLRLAFCYFRVPTQSN